MNHQSPVEQRLLEGSMIFTPCELAGAFLVELEPKEDARGYFSRVYCEREFLAKGLPRMAAQANVSMTRRAGTLRGMHWQHAPHEEDKLVRCVSGSVWDVIVDIRPGSPTYCRWLGVELSDSNQRMLFVPKGFAHGFLTRSDDVVVSYMMSQFHEPAAAAGARHDDPAFGIEWPGAVMDMSEKDRLWPPFRGPASTRKD
jgi:dTDP-4-dehydrorhamnose 3,5-epimerase